VSGRRNAGCGGWSGRRGALRLSGVHGWVKKAAASGGSGSSEQGSA
jgi:hypothetical protein